MLHFWFFRVHADRHPSSFQRFAQPRYVIASVCRKRTVWGGGTRGWLPLVGRWPALQSAKAGRDAYARHKRYGVWNLGLLSFDRWDVENALFEQTCRCAVSLEVGGESIRDAIKRRLICLLSKNFIEQRGIYSFSPLLPFPDSIPAIGDQPVSSPAYRNCRPHHEDTESWSHGHRYEHTDSKVYQICHSKELHITSSSEHTVCSHL